MLFKTVTSDVRMFRGQMDIPLVREIFWSRIDRFLLSPGVGRIFFGYFSNMPS
jgi:hypothetical protein